jgi:hypothetical protein
LPDGPEANRPLSPDEEGPSSTPFTRLGILGLFPFQLCGRNPMEYRDENLSGFLARIQVFLSSIPGETFVGIFLEWMKQLEPCIDVNGEYVG